MRWITLPLLVLVSAGLAYGLWPRGSAPADDGLELAALVAALGDDWEDSWEDGWENDGGDDRADAAARAAPVDEPLRFPADHRAHPDAPAEVWDLSAILNAGTDREASLRLTLVRLALAPSESDADPSEGFRARPEERPDARSGEDSRSRAAPQEGASAGARSSAFATEEVIAGQLLLSAPGEAPPVRIERVSRAALGLAGSESGDAGRERVWLEDWELIREEKQLVRVKASGHELALSISLASSKAPVPLDETIGGSAPEGDSLRVRGYSEPRLRVSGTLAVAGDAHEVQGIAWLEHAWGSLGEALSSTRGQLVANRFRLQLSNGDDLSCLHLRRRSGGGTPIPSCALIDRAGGLTTLGRRDLSLAAADETWSLAGHGRYPLRWRLSIPSRELELEISPLLDDPSTAVRTFGLGGGVPTWSGPVQVSGQRGSDAISGVGFMDLTGYGAASAGT